MIKMQDQRRGRWLQSMQKRRQSMLNMHQFLSAVGFSLLAGVGVPTHIRAND
jgi:hypothetical protein